jgi:hypothetical protein
MRLPLFRSKPIDGFYLSTIPKPSSWEFLEKIVRLAHQTR